MEKVDIFLKKLKEDSLEYKGLETNGYSLAEEKNTIRSLMSIRMPRELSDELASLQDAYLQEELNAKGVVTLSDIPTIKEQFHSKSPYADKISLWQGDHMERVIFNVFKDSDRELYEEAARRNEVKYEQR